jgi:hypothetical protein
MVHRAGYTEEPIIFEVPAPEDHPVVRTPTRRPPGLTGKAMISPHQAADEYDG